MAIYLRLSMKDGEDRQTDESNSIRNQRKQIYEYIHRDAELSLCEVMEFCDDGYSGTNLERPGLQRMLKKVLENRIHCILVKDMSRFSRDYMEMGTYLNQIFPFMGVRFIAINDHYDSRNHSGSTMELDTAFQTLLYDLYSKDVSEKVKAVFEKKCAGGEYVFGQVPFGYEKSRTVKHAVVVKETEAEIVRCIFSLAVQGESSTQIARRLYEEKIPTITQMRKPQKQYADGRIHSWSGTAVRKILNNRFYLGEMLYGKSVRKFVGSKNGISVPREEWNVIKNHHEALISEEIYERVSSFERRHSKKKENPAKQKRNGKRHPLTGKLYCGGCGYALSYKPIRVGKRCRGFECGKRTLFKIPECCTYIKGGELEEIVLLALNQELMLGGDAGRQRERWIAFQKAGILHFKKKQEKLKAKIRRERAKKDMLYERYALHRAEMIEDLAREDYQKSADKLAEQISGLSEKAEETALKLAELENEYQKISKDTELVFQCLRIEELTQEVVDTFVRNVSVYQDKRIEIVWNFASVLPGLQRERAAR